MSQELVPMSKNVVPKSRELVPRELGPRELIPMAWEFDLGAQE